MYISESKNIMLAYYLGFCKMYFKYVMYTFI